MINEVFIFNGRQQLGRTELKLVAAELRAGGRADGRRRSNNAHTIYSLTVCTAPAAASSATTENIYSVAAAECNVELASQS